VPHRSRLADVAVYTSAKEKDARALFQREREIG